MRPPLALLAPLVFLCSAGTLALSTASARADEVVLTNGRVLRGRILSSDERSVVIRSGRGQMAVPRSSIARVVSARSPRSVLAERREALDPEDGEGLRALAEWAAANGLGPEARELESQARDIALARRLARAKAEDSARAFVAAFHWARQAGVGRSILVDLLEEATARDPQDPELGTALASFARQLADEEARLGAALQALKRPRYVDPNERDRLQGISGGGILGPGGRPMSVAELTEEWRQVRAARAAAARRSEYHRGRGVERAR